jgi:hypothetical protein
MALSRNAQKRNIDKSLGIKNHKKPTEDRVHSVITGMPAANEEILAEQRQYHKERKEVEFHSKIKMAVARR